MVTLAGMIICGLGSIGVAAVYWRKTAKSLLLHPPPQIAKSDPDIPDLVKQLMDISNTNLSLSIVNVQLNIPGALTDSTGIVILASIRNDGAPSVALNYKLSLNVPGFHSHQAE